MNDANNHVTIYSNAVMCIGRLELEELEDSNLPMHITASISAHPSLYAYHSLVPSLGLRVPLFSARASNPINAFPYNVVDRTLNFF